MLRARKAGILTPVIYSVQHEAATIFMERVDGVSVKETLLSGSLTANGMHQSLAATISAEEGSSLCVVVALHTLIGQVACAAEINDMLTKIGQVVATLHDGGLVHGDLTTSNMLVRSNDKAVVRHESTHPAAVTNAL